jgi:hypothetical protein
MPDPQDLTQTAQVTPQATPQAMPMSPTAGTGLYGTITGTAQPTVQVPTGLWATIMNLAKFMQATPASASNDAKYQKYLTDAGIDPDDTGVGK